MLNKLPDDVQSDGAETPDQRVVRSSRALAAALSELLHERSFNDITVQQIIDRAGVARATFYARYRNKDDALYSSYEQMIAGLEHRMEQRASSRARLAPVTELLAHLASAPSVVDSLRASDRLEMIWELGTGFFTEMIERRAPLFAGGTVSASAVPRLEARMLAAALMELTKWWLEHPQRMTAAALDDHFHDMARRVLVPSRHINARS
jgi:AcrR family transcriptional regulator